MKASFRLAILIISLVNVIPAVGQNLTISQPSPKAMVMQTVGLTDITIVYHSPAIRGRKVWGELVPYGFEKNNPAGNGKPMPWQAGANENTTIAFSTDVMVEGKPLAAGIYGLHMIPGGTTFVIIFSHNTTSWGSFFYEESEDALRVDVTPEWKNEIKERLAYGFENTTDSKTIAYLRWEKIKIPIKIEVDLIKTTLTSMKLELRSIKGTDPKNLIQAANFCVQQNVNLQDALAWSESAIARQGGASALFTKMSVLEKMGRFTDAETVKQAAVEAANEKELNVYAYSLLSQKKIDEAIILFMLNVKRNPDSFNAYDSLGEALAAKGDKKQAIANYTRALRLSTDGDNKKRISDIIASLRRQSDMNSK